MAHFFAFCFTPWHFLNNAFYKLVKTKFWCLSSTLRTWRNNGYITGSDLEILIKGGSLRPYFFSNCLFVSFSIPSLLPFSILSLLPFLISPSLSTIPSCFLINCLSYDKHFMFHSVSLLSQAPLARGSCALPSVLFNEAFAHFLMEEWKKPQYGPILVRKTVYISYGVHAWRWETRRKCWKKKRQIISNVNMKKPICSLPFMQIGFPVGTF